MSRTSSEAFFLAEKRILMDRDYGVMMPRQVHIAAHFLGPAEFETQARWVFGQFQVHVRLWWGGVDHLRVYKMR